MNNIKIQGYQIENQVIGSGTYGNVFRAKDSQTGETKAVKILKLEGIQQDQVAYVYKNQLRALKLLRGKKNIVHLDKFIQHQENRIFILKYYRNGDLKKLITNNGPFPQDKLRDYMKQILVGYLEIKKVGLIHRDIKPSNILIDEDEKVKICDFGFSILEKQAVLEEDQRIGSPFHMAPEIIQLNKYSTKSDIWALGILYYEMLTGKYLYVSSDPEVILKLIKKYPIQAILSSDISEISELDKKILTKTLKINPEERPTPEQLLQMLSPEKKTPYLSKYSFTIKNSRFLHKAFDLTKIQSYLVKMVKLLFEDNLQFNAIIKGSGFIELLETQQCSRLNKIQKLLYLTSEQKKEFETTKQFASIMKKIKEFKENNNLSHQKLNKIIRNRVCPIDQILTWLHANIKTNNRYLFFVLYDYLVTYRWTWNMRYTPQQQQNENLAFMQQPSFEVNRILNSLKKQMVTGQKISQNNLNTMEYKLIKLDIISKE